MYRRNGTFSLEPLPRPAAQEPRQIRGMYVLGMAVNPRDHRPVLVVTDHKHVGIRSLHDDRLLFRHGSGYYDTDSYGRSAEAERESGFPRVHTPTGVEPKGGGYGTSLYAALAMGAYLNSRREVSIRMDTEGEGICSEGTRSDDATAWWDRALAKGLTERTQFDDDEKCEENIDIRVDKKDLQRIADLEEGKRITYVNEVSVDICEDIPGLVVDVLEYTSAWNADLLPFELCYEIPKDIRPGSELRYIVEELLDSSMGAEFGDANPDALLALDVRGLNEEVIKILSLAYAQADLENEIDALWHRWQNNLDPGTPYQQLRLTPNAARAASAHSVLDARGHVAWDLLADLP